MSVSVCARRLPLSDDLSLLVFKTDTQHNTTQHTRTRTHQPTQNKCSLSLLLCDSKSDSNASNADDNHDQVPGWKIKHLGFGCVNVNRSSNEAAEPNREKQTKKMPCLFLGHSKYNGVFSSS